MPYSVRKSQKVAKQLNIPRRKDIEEEIVDALNEFERQIDYELALKDAMIEEKDKKLREMDLQIEETDKKIREMDLQIEEKQLALMQLRIKELESKLNDTK